MTPKPMVWTTPPVFTNTRLSENLGYPTPQRVSSFCEIRWVRVIIPATYMTYSPCLVSIHALYYSRYFSGPLSSSKLRNHLSCSSSKPKRNESFVRNEMLIWSGEVHGRPHVTSCIAEHLASQRSTQYAF